MQKSNLTIVIALVIVAVAVGLVVANTNQETPVDNPPTATSSDQDGVVRTINARHQFNAETGQHTLTGTTTVPTPCHKLETSVEIQESLPEQVVVNFSTDKPDTDQVCAQVITQRQFDVSFSASQDAEISGGNFDDDKLRLNIRSVQGAKTGTDTSIYSKG